MLFSFWCVLVFSTFSALSFNLDTARLSWLIPLINISIFTLLSSAPLTISFSRNQFHLWCVENGKNTHGGVLLLVKLQVKACKFTKINTPPCVFFTFFELCKWYQSITFFNEFFRSLLSGAEMVCLSSILKVLVRAKAINSTSDCPLFTYIWRKEIF